MLEEVQASEALALCLWRDVRNVHLWLAADGAVDDELFRSGSWRTRERLAQAGDDAPDIADALHALDAPHLAERREIGAACDDVYRWSEAQGYVLTALRFAELAANVVLEDPAAANNAGWMCRRAALPDRSTAWYQRAYVLARHARSDPEMIRALLGYGSLMKDLGRENEARPYYERAARRAVRSGRRREAASARHYLLGLAAESGAYEEGERHAEQALHLYPVKDPRIPYLVHDYAFLLMRQRFYSPALRLLEKLSAATFKPDERILVYSSIAWAAAGAGVRAKFDGAERTVLQLVEDSGEFAAAAYLHLGKGARILERWRSATEYARKAHEVAQARQDATLERVTAMLMAKTEAQTPATPEQLPPHPERVDALSRWFILRLRTWKPHDLTSPGLNPSGAQVRLRAAGS
ncbi:MAG TPA: hypothetical protein VNP72_03290 [Longimicrobium sp.]|nr:hypothetical protein [Longimicrobium sp.]